jgi:hypothetical protein
MKVKKGQRVKVVQSRKLPRPYFAKATKDFDTELDEWYPLVLDQEARVEGVSSWWGDGAELPERKGITTIEATDEVR